MKSDQKHTSNKDPHGHEQNASIVTADMLQYKQQIYNNTISIHYTTSHRYATLQEGVPRYKQLIIYNINYNVSREEVMYHKALIQVELIRA